MEKITNIDEMWCPETEEIKFDDGSRVLGFTTKFGESIVSTTFGWWIYYVSSTENGGSYFTMNARSIDRMFSESIREIDSKVIEELEKRIKELSY